MRSECAPSSVRSSVYRRREKTSATSPKDIGHVAGYVAEWLWYLHATELADAARAPLYLEPPSGQVTAPGHDGFVIYEQTADQQTIFRLWEVKKHDSSASATSVVKRATTQLNKFGDDYLAQLTAPLSERTDAVGDMARQSETWHARWSISGSTLTPAQAPGSASPPRPPRPPTGCFDGVGTALTQFPAAGQIEGLLMTVTDLENLAIDVRSYLWTVL